jgi:hypothetical protein
MLNHPFEDLAGWTRHFSQYDVPVLDGTAQAIARLREVPDRADANVLANVALRDPLMTLKLLAHISRKLSGRVATPVETVTAGLVLTGIEPFFNAFANLPVAQERLAGEPGALHGVQRIVRRALRAARMALGFAVHRQDDHAEVLHQAALLDSFADLLVWLEAPALALEMQRRQQEDPALRTAQVQKDVLNVNLGQLEQALMAKWELPGVLCHLVDTQATEPGPRSVMLAVKIARHTERGWDNAALPDDFSELARLLNLSSSAARELCVRLDS